MNDDLDRILNWKPGQIIPLRARQSFANLDMGNQGMMGQMGQMANQGFRNTDNVRLTNCVWYDNSAALANVNIATNYLDDRSWMNGYGFGIGLPAAPVVDPLAEYCPVLDERDPVIPATPWYTRWWITVLRWILRRLA